MRRRRAIALLAAALAATAAAVGAVALLGDGEGPEEGRAPAPRAPAEKAPAEEPPRVEVVLQNDLLLRESPPEEIRRVAGELADDGVDRIRLTAAWWWLAPANESPVRPAFDAADPAAYPQDAWIQLETAVQIIREAGMEPMIDVAFWAPRWAVERPSPESQHRWRPSAEEFGLFAHALTTRLKGEVDLWTTWNEPNHPAFLLPQWERRGGRWVPESPHVYRAMHEAAYQAIKAVDPSSSVLIGGLSSIGYDERGTAARMTPLLFVREMACVDARLAPLRRPECRDYRPLRADGFAHHPYGFTLPPDVPPEIPGNVTMADLSELSDLLDALRLRGRIEGRWPLYLTELGWETNPPDPYRGVPLDAQAQYISQSAAIAWARPDVRMIAQYLYADVPPDPNASPDTRGFWSTFQTGLLFADGTPKPALQAFRLPLWIGPAAGGAGFRAWAQVRPGSGPRPVAFERLLPDGAWAEAVPELATATDGTIEQALTDPGTYRLRWRRPDGSLEYSLPAVAGAAP